MNGYEAFILFVVILAIWSIAEKYIEKGTQNGKNRLTNRKNTSTIASPS